MKPKNLKEFKALIKRYESITLKEIEEVFDDTYIYTNDPANRLTGFGSSKCPLCKKINVFNECNGCVYTISRGCLKGINKETYNAIENADTSQELLNAFRARAKHMKTLIK